jgi:hypothetical protein
MSLAPDLGEDHPDYVDEAPHQSSRGSSERIIGWSSSRALRLACLFGESSQQPTLPH